MVAPDRLNEAAPAKVNLTLRVLGRRADGYHELESLVAFAKVGDELGLVPGDDLALTVSGAGAAEAGQGADNLVVKAARALSERVPGLRLGRFHLVKRLPVAAGLGGGSADAAAALRLLARANGLTGGEGRIFDAARSIGADVPVCLEPRPRVMRGIGEILSAPFSLPPLPAVLVNPGVAVSTKAVFAGWQPTSPAISLDLGRLANIASREEFTQFLLLHANDLEAPAMALAPAIAEVLVALRALPGCALARMSGSGATCFGLFDKAAAAIEAATALSGQHPHWWVRATALGGG